MNLFPSFGFLPKEGRPSASFGKLHLWRGGAFRRKRTSFGKLHLWRLPSESFTSGGGHASSRRKGRSPPEVKLPEGSETSSASFRKRGTAGNGVRFRVALLRLPQLDEKSSLSSVRESGLTPTYELSFRRKRTCYTSFGFLREASPLAGWRLS